MKRFDFNQVIKDMDAELLLQDAANEEQRKWREHDDAKPLGEAALIDIQTDLV